MLRKDVALELIADAIDLTIRNLSDTDEEYNLCKNIINEFSINEQKVATLFYGDKKSIIQIAKEIGIKDSSVTRYLCKMKQALKLKMFNSVKIRLEDCVDDMIFYRQLPMRLYRIIDIDVLNTSIVNFLTWDYKTLTNKIKFKNKEDYNEIIKIVKICGFSSQCKFIY